MNTSQKHSRRLAQREAPEDRRRRACSTHRFHRKAPGPITNDGIKEVYWLAVQAKSAGLREIPIEIFPARLTDKGFQALAGEHRNQPELNAFWGNLKEGFDFFEKTRRQPRIKTRGDGTYAFGE